LLAVVMPRAGVGIESPTMHTTAPSSQIGVIESSARVFRGMSWG
jgi:hypothetical protein